MIERFNVWPLMPPSEVEQLAFDLLADVAPPDDRPESVTATSRFVSTVIEFCHDWRSLWHLHGDVPEARGQFESLVGVTRRKLRQLPPVRVASTNNFARQVLHNRLLAMLFGGASGMRPEAAEFNVAAEQAEAGAEKPVTTAADPQLRNSARTCCAAERHRRHRGSCRVP